MQKNDDLTVFLKVVVIGKTYEVRVGGHACFHDVIDLLRMMIRSDLEGMYDLDSEVMIFEYGSMQKCDPDVSLRSLGVKEGMTFLVF